MPILRVEFQGALGEISASSFAFVIRCSIDVLHDLDRRISEEPKGTLKWVIQGLGEDGIAYVNLTATRRQLKQPDLAPRVVRSFREGVTHFQSERSTPPDFSSSNMVKLHELVRNFSHDGIRGVQYQEQESYTSSGPALLTRSDESDLEKLVGERYRAVGSVEGTIELVSVRRRARRFNITLNRTKLTIPCNLPFDMEGSVLEAIKDRRRVVATGLVGYNAKNEPIRLEIKRPLRFLNVEDDLPTVDELKGSAPDLAGDLSAEDFVRSLRDG